MRLGALAVLGWMALQASGPASVSDFAYHRMVGGMAPGASPRNVCAALDGAVFAHAQPTLADVRLYAADGQARTEVPYVLTASETALTSDAATVVNLGAEGGHVAFDLQMPDRPYTSVELDLAGQNFLATARVTGRKDVRARGGTDLGVFTLFDLSGQRLGRSTTLPLSESTFPVLHVDLEVKAAPGTGGGAALGPAMVRGAEVPPSRQAQTLYTVVETTGKIVQRGRESVANFNVAAHVPIERVSFVMAAGNHGNFSRDVRVTATVAGGAEPESVRGTISRVRMSAGGQEIREESLGFPAVLGANAREATKVEVAIENGDDRPLALAAVRLEMRERRVCFDASAGLVELFYGDAQLGPPVYDFVRTFQAGEKTQTVGLGAELRNRAYEAPADQRTFVERHPEVVWLALLGVVGVLGVVAFRSVKRV